LLLPRKLADQDKQFANAFQQLKQSIAERDFPGASVAVLYRGELIALRAFGRYTYDPDSTLVSPATIFDIASVSKVMATTTAAAILHERGLFALDSTVPGRPDLTLRGLLTHTSGLPAYIKLFLQTRDREELLRLACATPLEAPSGSRTEYSDIGFIILGHVIEKLSAEPFDQFCQREIFSPLGLTDTCFNPPAALRTRVAPTASNDSLRHYLVQGEVHDENAWVLKGVAGHAGLFCTTYDLALFAQLWLGARMLDTAGARSLREAKGPVLRPTTIAHFTRQQPNIPRALGWDRPTPPSSSGRYFSPASFGHLGFTGTSLWCDPEKELAVVLLTNRVWPDSKNQAIKQVRPRIHDAIVEAL
jgi:CubicO group peptidase (beta-lactamase class C family)